jgi:cell division septum initiation protein DivIVA
VGEHQPPHRAHDEGEAPFSAGVLDVRDPLPEELRDPSFPSAVRGYERRSVDQYVQRINRVIAELQISGSPSAAVRHALDRVGEQTSGILRRARETAEEITKTAGEEADEVTSRAKAAAGEITAAAQQQAGEIADQARAQADEIVAAARARADEIVAHATDEADETLAEARRSADANTRTAEEGIARLRATVAAVAEERRRVLDQVRELTARLEAAVAAAEPGMSEHTVAMYMLERNERAERAWEELARVIGDAQVSRPDETGIFEIRLEAADQEQALQRVWDAVALAGADDHIVFAEHPELPEHWRPRSAAPR